ncbi:uncharacterized protein LOC100253453 isoform X1 [Vitis vinifera]|uniref:uncharacterized protein LOC100253453 isoform X1 n=1 Tax=Vitis vinifera TaxID=29760 RepID=UPI000198564B|nr:uncharacterized protein LOC100253453 isoform X1 [Vitis vinifera]|eukprot:XP_010645879.1 PREDICTED: far upstream element-binding protein 1 isoform X1 [Vitis vinifera]
MAEEEVVVVAGASPAPSDHKRKLEDLEPEAPEQAEPDGVQGADAGDYVANDESEAKRPRVEDQDDDLATENGYQREKEDEVIKENVELTVENAQSQEAPHPTEEAPEAVNDEQPSTDNEQKEDTQEPSIENPQLENPQQPTGEEFEKPAEEIPQQEVGDVPSAEVQQQPTSETQTMSRKMEVPNNKVGVLIGKAGDTIRFLQYNSGAKIQITRDADADPYSASRPVELIGSLENINKAEKLIKDVIAEADAGGSPSLVARGFATAQAVGAAEQVQIQVPNEKVGLIIGKGGETIKSLQTRSGARIQVLIPQHLPEGDQSKERTVRVTGDKKQIEMAREMIKEVMNQPVRSSTYPGSYNQQGYRPRGPTGPSQWGPRGPHPGQPTGYDYQRGAYPSQNQQYAPPSYGGYPPQQMAPRSSFGSGWEQRPPANMQGPPQSGGYDFYGGQGGHGPDAPAAAPHSASMSIHAPGPSPSPGMGPPPSQGNYNYGQPQGPDYGQQAQYSQTGPPQQGYGHGYDEPKYEGQAPTHPPYGGHGSQPVYPQGGAQSGYPPQQPYGKPQSYGMASQAPAAQSYGPPRASQPGDVPYQGPMSSNQSYGPNVPPQQYPYASSGPMQQSYPAYGSQPAADGYNQPQPASGPGYPQQGGQPMSGYSQPGGQQAPGYAQVGPQGGYGPYPSQPGYAEQQTANNAAYGYQGSADPTYNSGPASAYGAQPSGQPGYVQPTPTQPSYDQSIPAQSGGYGAVPATAPVGYGKSLSPQPGYPQYDATQMYGAHR